MQLEQQFAVAAELFEAGDIAGAAEMLEEMLAKAPGHPIILNHLAVVAHMTGDHARAEVLLGDAARIMPDYFDAWNNLGLVSFEQGKYDIAAHAFEKACGLAPNTPDTIINLGHALHALNRCAEATTAYQKGLALQPGHPSAWTTYCRALLEEGRWADAAKAADRQLTIQPGHTVALALKSVALQEIGDGDALRRLVDFDRLIGSFDIDVPDGYADLEAFNQAICDFCQNHRSLKYAPADKATELGSQTNNLAPEPDTPITDLLKAIERCATQYRRERPVSGDHPFLSQRPDAWQTDIWATVLESGGHQQSHIHRVGWLSGVYYARKPDVIEPAMTTTDKAGWIEFGRPVYYPKAETEPETRCYPPIEGRLYLFPSYFYHRTIPFFSATRRISLAFDLRDQPLRRQVPFIDYVDG